MATGRDEDIKLLIHKFMKLVDSLNPGEKTAGQPADTKVTSN